MKNAINAPIVLIHDSKSLQLKASTCKNDAIPTSR